MLTNTTNNNGGASGVTPVTPPSSPVDGLAQAMGNPPPSIRSVIVRLLSTLSSKKEVNHYKNRNTGWKQKESEIDQGWLNGD